MKKVEKVIRTKKEGFQLPPFFGVYYKSTRSCFCNIKTDKYIITKLDYETDACPLAITSDKRFIAALHPFGSQGYYDLIKSICSGKYSRNCINYNPKEDGDDLILIYDLQKDEILLKLLFRNCKDSYGVTNIKNIEGIGIKVTSIEFSKDDSVLFLNSDALITEDDFAYSLALPINLMKRNLTINQTNFLCGLKYYVEKQKKDFSDIKTLITLTKR